MMITFANVSNFSATICSIFKTIDLKIITQTQDPTWDGVNLTIWSSCELSIGIIIASLPPLRKAFDDLFKKLLPSTLTNPGKPPQNGYGNSTNIHMSTFQSGKAYHSRLPGGSVLDDSDSDRAVLEDEEGKAGMIKTTKVMVTEEVEESSSKGSGSSQKQSCDWPSPKPDHEGRFDLQRSFRLHQPEAS
jgi:hypothetical protein